MQKIDTCVVINYKTTCNHANLTDDVAKIYNILCNVTNITDLQQVYIATTECKC